MIVRASIREPATNASVSRPVDHPDRARHVGGMDVEEAEDEEGGERRGDDPARGAPHVARRDVAPPAVVEAEEREDRELDRRDERRGPPSVDVALVVDRQVGVEAEPEGEEPGGDDDREVRRELRQPMPVDRESHALAATPTAAADDVDHALLLLGGDARPERHREVLRAARSVSGSAPSS